MLAPILAFTADEAWEFVPGKVQESVHKTSWLPSIFSASESELNVWRVLFVIRDMVLPELEKARQAKIIGKSLDAKIEIPKDELASQLGRLEDLRELLNVSQISPSNTATSVVSKADGEKCERCWHWETTVGSNPDHPTICAPCVEAVKQARATS